MDYSGCLKIYRLLIDWQMLHNTQNRPQPEIKISPVLNVTYLDTLQNCSQLPRSLSASSSARLIHLRVLTSTEDPVTSRTLPTTIMAIFSTLNPSSLLSPDTASYYSIAAFWELNEKSMNLHSSFRTIVAKKRRASVVFSKVNV